MDQINQTQIFYKEAMRATIAVLLLSLVLSSTHLSYLSLPFIRSQNSTHTVHNIELAINDYSYHLDINFRGERDYFVSLQEARSAKRKTSDQDLRRSSDMVYGVLEFTGVQVADPRLPFFSASKQNAYFYLRDLFPQRSWIYLNEVVQLSAKESPDKMTEGAVNLAFVSYSPFLRNIERYNPYVKDSIISFKLHDDQSKGEIFIGAFPKDELISQKYFGEVKVKNDHQKSWKVTTDSIQLKTSEKENIQIFNVPFQFKLSTSEKTLQLPKKACENLVSALKECSMKLLGEEKLLVCPRQSYMNSESELEVHFYQTLKGLKLKLKDLQREIVREEVVFNIREGGQADYHLSSVILEDYLIGLDYKKGVFFFGEKKKDPFMDRNLVFKLFLAANAIALVASLLIVALAYRCKLKGGKEGPNKEKEGVLYSASKASGYEMAILTEDVPGEAQD